MVRECLLPCCFMGTLKCIPISVSGSSALALAPRSRLEEFTPKSCLKINIDPWKNKTLILRATMHSSHLTVLPQESTRDAQTGANGVQFPPCLFFVLHFLQTLVVCLEEVCWAMHHGGRNVGSHRFLLCKKWRVGRTILLQYIKFHFSWNIN